LREAKKYLLSLLHIEVTRLIKRGENSSNLNKRPASPPKKRQKGRVMVRNSVQKFLCSVLGVHISASTVQKIIDRALAAVAPHYEAGRDTYHNPKR
jgi:hypothetical protein